MKGKLYMIPTLLAEGTEQTVIPLSVKESIRDISYFLCENVRTARRYISVLKVHDSIESLRFELLDKDTAEGDLEHLFIPVNEGQNAGVISESGCPGIADPGALAVAYAHRNHIDVIPLVGPSSLVLALMGSGLNGQQFAFHGYLPIDPKEASKRIKTLEHESREKNQTQLFIETPYRNQALLGHLLKCLRPDTQLCIAIHLTSEKEKIVCQKVSQWHKQPVSFEKEPAVFLFLAAS